MDRRGLRLLFVAALCAALMVPVQASAETAAQLKTRLDALQDRSAQAGRDFSTAYWRLDETEVALAKTRNSQRKTEKRLAKARRRLNERAGAIYRRDALDAVHFLVGASSFEQFVARADYIARVGLADALLVSRVKRLRGELRAEEKRLKAEHRSRTARLSELRGQRDRLQSQLRSIQAEYASVKRRLDTVRSGGNLPQGVLSAAGSNGMVFPVAGSHYYADTWGASRSGGRRRHQGTDIMSPRGTPCVAVSSGTVTTRSNGLGGLTIWLRSDSGWSFYYAHLNSYAVQGGRVRAGQVIGYVGSTGNAVGGSPHLHFEMHPGGGAAVNPYPYLRAME